MIHIPKSLADNRTGREFERRVNKIDKELLKDLL